MQNLANLNFVWQFQEKMSFYLNIFFLKNEKRFQLKPELYHIKRNG
jgi:hypothetical protein